MTKLKVTAVSYLNTKPLLYGLVSDFMRNWIDLSLDIPSVCADKLESGEVDLGLVPVAVIPKLKTPYIVSDYCIGTVGAVKTVCIFSEVPIEKITHLYLDFHSRTSVELVKLLFKNHWKSNPVFLSTEEGFEQNIQGTTAAVVIGDRTIGLHQKFPYVYDLGQTWMDYCNLPFVFAAWVSNRPLDPEFIKIFNRALVDGIKRIPQLIYLLPNPGFGFDLEEYFTRYISYELDSKKKLALTKFLEAISLELQPTLAGSLSR